MPNRKVERRLDDLAAIIGATLLAIALWLTAMAALLTHVVVCIKASAWVLLFAGGLIFPVAIVHGIGCWFGAF